MEVTQRLREFRARKGFSQDGMAKLAEISQSAWSLWEKEAPEQFATLRRLAEKSATSADYILGITDDPTPPTKRAEWTPEASAAAELIAGLPNVKQPAALAVLKAAVTLAQTQVAESEPALNVEHSRTRAAAEKEEILELLRRMLTPVDYDAVLRAVQAGRLLTESEFARLVNSSGNQQAGEVAKLLNDQGIRGG